MPLWFGKGICRTCLMGLRTIPEPTQRVIAATFMHAQGFTCQCVQYAAYIPLESSLSDCDIFNIQFFLVHVWQHHIKQWHAGEDLTIIPQNINSHQVLRGEDVEENGHLLSVRVNGTGIWCKRCRTFTSMLKHVRLKITKKACANPNGPILAQEGHNMAETRLDQLEHELNVKYNLGGHSLQWNRLLGKEIGSPNEG